MPDPKDTTPPVGEFLVYVADDGATRVDVRFSGETAWLSLGQMAELFQRDKSVISRHVKNAFDDGEVGPGATVAKSATVQRELFQTTPQNVTMHLAAVYEEAELDEAATCKDCL
jgi:hypothetical protein